MGAAVLLLHRLPDGSSHYDWMIQREPGAGGSVAPPDGFPLVTFRVRERIDQSSSPRRFSAERLTDHRADYLTYEGAVTGGRGTVERVAEGFLAIQRDEPDGFTCEGRLGEVSGVWEGAPASAAGPLWRFVVLQ